MFRNLAKESAKLCAFPSTAVMRPLELVHQDKQWKGSILKSGVTAEEDGAEDDAVKEQLSAVTKKTKTRETLVCKLRKTYKKWDRWKVLITVYVLLIR